MANPRTGRLGETAARAMRPIEQMSPAAQQAAKAVDSIPSIGQAANEASTVSKAGRFAKYAKFAKPLTYLASGAVGYGAGGDIATMGSGAAQGQQPVTGLSRLNPLRGELEYPFQRSAEAALDIATLGAGPALLEKIGADLPSRRAERRREQETNFPLLHSRSALPPMQQVQQGGDVEDYLKQVEAFADEGNLNARLDDFKAGDTPINVGRNKPNSEPVYFSREEQGGGSGSGVPALGPVGYQRTQERPVALPEYQRYNVETAPKQNYISLQDAVNQLYGGQNLSAMSPEDFFVRNSLINAKMAESGRDVNRADRLWKERQSALGQSADINNRGLKSVYDIQQGGQREDTLRRNLEMQEQMAPYEMQEKQARAQSELMKADALQRGLKSGALNDADIAGIQNTARERMEVQKDIELSKRLTEIDKMPEGPDKAQAIADAWAWRRGMERYTAAEEQPESGFWPFKREAVPAQYGYRKANIPALSSNF